MLAEVEDLDDVRMGEAGHHLGLVDEHVHELLVVGQVGQDALDRHHLLEPLDAGALGPEHLRHPADRDTLEQAVGTVVAGRGEARARRARRALSSATGGAPVSAPPAGTSGASGFGRGLRDESGGLGRRQLGGSRRHPRRARRDRDRGRPRTAPVARGGAVNFVAVRLAGLTASGLVGRRPEREGRAGG